jgi:DsbC/DsbD-like thiol-disulfide interchange protein
MRLTVPSLIFSSTIVSSTIVLLALAAPAAVANAAARDENHVAVTLVSEQTALVPGKTAWLGIVLKHQPHWHTYWVNPGDSGLPTKLRWQLPPGFKPGDIAWPAPQRFSAGEVYNFGYAGQVLLPVPIEVPADARPGSVAHLAVEVKWLVCREECIPGKATLNMSLAVAAQAAPDRRSSKLFAGARAKLPQPAAWRADAHLIGDRIEVVLQGTDLPPAATLDAFTPQMRVLACAPPQVSRDGTALHLSFAKNEYFAAPPAALELVLVSGAPPQARSMTASFAATPAPSSKP